MSSIKWTKNTIIGIIYGSIQTILAAFISIVGAIHVQRCIQQQKNKIAMTQTIELAGTTIAGQDAEADDINEDGDAKEAHDPPQQKESELETERKEPSHEEVEEATAASVELESAPPPQPRMYEEQAAEHKDEEPQETKEAPSSNPSAGTGDELEDALNDDDAIQKPAGFCTLWLRTIWKMRSVYGGLAVHSFDVLTDILVIYEWITAENYEGDNVDPQAMAYTGIAILVASRIVSCIAIYLKERDLRRCLLQFFDFLIFEEIYESHKKIVSQIKNKQSLKEKNAAIESTLSFKYVRNFEAVFESIPQSVLQLVYIMRIPAEFEVNGEIIKTNKYDWIFWTSIAQSMISMTNSIINNDNTQMQDDEFKRHKRRLPPTHEFLRHLIGRLSEVVYRIGLLALIWTVCGGTALAVVLAVDLVLIIAKTIFFTLVGSEYERNADTVLLNVNQLIVLPSEEVFNGVGFTSEDDYWYMYVGAGEDEMSWFMFLCVVNCFCCIGLAAFLSVLSEIISKCSCKIQAYPMPTMRIGISLIELMFLIFYGIYAENGERKPFLFSDEHGLYVFIATCVSLLLYSQYLVLLPRFALPGNVAVRSRWGYAYANELSEIKKIKVRQKGHFCERQIYQQCDDDSGPNEEAARFIERVQKKVFSDLKLTKPGYTASGEFIVGNTTFQTFYKDPSVTNTRKERQLDANEFWDQTHDGDFRGVSPAMFALARENYDIVEWLEEQGATLHIERNIDTEAAKKLIDDLKKDD